MAAPLFVSNRHRDTTAVDALVAALEAQGDLAGALDLEKSALTTRRRMLAAIDSAMVEQGGKAP